MHGQTEKTYTVKCPCGATSAALGADDAMRWGSCHRCE